MTFKRLISFTLCVILFISVCLCHTGCNKEYPNPVLTINFAGGTSDYRGTVKIELYPDKAPNTVRNIIYLVKSGFYDGLKVNMAVAGSFIEIADGSGLNTLPTTGQVPDYAIEGEFLANDFGTNDLKFEKGSVALSRYEKTDYDSGVDGFFITLGEFPDADGEFAIFGKVIEGIDVIEDISNMKVTGAALHYEPVYSVKVDTATVATMGRKFEEPDKITRKYYVWNSYCPWWTPDKE